MHDFIFHLIGHKTVISQRLTHFTINDYIMKSSMISLSAVQAIGLGTMPCPNAHQSFQTQVILEEKENKICSVV